jgi:serine/threonine-protein kinase PpkA
MQAPIEIPNFELLQEIGRGGMARVYLGQQLEPKRKIAVKVVSPGVGHDESFMQSLKAEGDICAQLSHQNIVTVYACGVIEGHYYLAMEHLGGGDLSQRIKEGLSIDDALQIMKEMAGALEQAHAENLLHRVIKPENIMFHERGHSVLVDFGIAKEQDTESNFTKAGAVVGTPHYMSPERATGKAVNARSDLYALGVVFYEMLTGKKLYEGADTFAISYAHVYEPIPQLEEPNKGYQQLLNKLVAKDPDDRFQNAGELLKALEHPTSQVPLAADPSTNATMAVQAMSEPLPATSAALPKQDIPAVQAPAKKLPIVPFAAVAAILVVAVIGYTQLKPGDAGSDPGTSPTVVSSGSNLTTEQNLRMQDLLQSAATFSRIGNYQQAEENLVKVLQDFDCTDQEARRGLKALNPQRAQEIVAACDG